MKKIEVAGPVKNYFFFNNIEFDLVFVSYKKQQGLFWWIEQLNFL